MNGAFPISSQRTTSSTNAEVYYLFFFLTFEYRTSEIADFTHSPSCIIGQDVPTLVDETAGIDLIHAIFCIHSMPTGHRITCRCNQAPETRNEEYMEIVKLMRKPLDEV
jgi:hypothetical protein